MTASPVTASIVIPVHGKAALTRMCLDQLLAQPLGADAEIIVVDDASPDHTSSMLAALVAEGAPVRVVSHDDNAGFATACNNGAAAARGGYVVFLNNDTVPMPGWLQALVRHADTHPAAAAVGAKLLFPDGTVQHAGVVIGEDRNPHHIYAGFPGHHPAVNRTRRFQVVTGACLLVRRSVFLDHGGFDPAFRNGHEDVDLCLRLGRAGHEVWYCHESLLLHLESATRERVSAAAAANGRLYRERWAAVVQPDDVRHYLDDGLLTVSYADTHPLRLRVDPLLAMVDTETRLRDVERLLRTRADQVAELLREVVRLSTGETVALEVADVDADDELAAALATIHELAGRRSSVAASLEYRRLVREVRDTVVAATDPGDVVAVVSHGDDALVNLDDRVGVHFPQAPDGRYAGHHPADSDTALAELDRLRAHGVTHLVVPATSAWWLDHYDRFADRLHATSSEVVAGDACVVFALDPTAGPPRRRQQEGS